MMTMGRSIIAALVLGTLFAGLSGCQDKEGPAERAGKEIDQAVEKTDQQIDKSVKKSGEKLEKTGDHMEDAIDDLKK